MNGVDALRDLRVANFAIADACLFLRDIIRGDACGDIGNETAKRELNMLRLRFQSLALLSASIIDGLDERNKQ